MAVRASEHVRPAGADSSLQGISGRRSLKGRYDDPFLDLREDFLRVRLLFPAPLE